MDDIFQQKKQLVLDTLKMLVGYWEGAEGLSAIVESDFVDEELLDGLIQIFKQTVENIRNEEHKKRMQLSLDAISSLKERELQDSRHEKQDASGILGSMV